MGTLPTRLVLPLGTMGGRDAKRNALRGAPYATTNVSDAEPSVVATSAAAAESRRTRQTTVWSANVSSGSRVAPSIRLSMLLAKKSPHSAGFILSCDTVSLLHEQG